MSDPKQPEYSGFLGMSGGPAPRAAEAEFDHGAYKTDNRINRIQRRKEDRSSRPAIIEECARVCEGYYEEPDEAWRERGIAEELASAIRALAPGGQNAAPQAGQEIATAPSHEGHAAGPAVAALDDDALAVWKRASSGGIPDWKNLPLTPSDAMIEAGAQRLVRWETGKEVWPTSWDALDVRASLNDAEKVWRSMWLAAPAEVAEGAGEKGSKDEKQP